MVSGGCEVGDAGSGGALIGGSTVLRMFCNNI